jgi:hypothetical protein
LVSKDLSGLWLSLKSERKALLKLLARFALTNQQATRYYIQEVREKARVVCDDAQLIENPYIMYEQDRFASSGNDDERMEPIALVTIDRGMFGAIVKSGVCQAGLDQAASGC